MADGPRLRGGGALSCGAVPALPRRRRLAAAPAADGSRVDDDESLRKRIAELRTEHRDLDTAIATLEQGLYVDQLQVRRLKKRKLLLRDHIARLESRLIPDLDA
jgi:hypothetical protein